MVNTPEYLNICWRTCLLPVSSGFKYPENEETSASNVFVPISQDCTVQQPSKHPSEVSLSCKSEGLNYSSAPAKCHEMSCFIGGTKNALYQNPATFIHSPCVCCCASHCWVVIRITEVEHKWYKYIGRIGGALYFLETYLKWLNGLLVCLWFRLIISAQLVNWLSLFTFINMCLNLAMSFPYIYL
jgi:hypothetical protein